jgi:hypothetical protein
LVALRPRERAPGGTSIAATFCGKATALSEPELRNEAQTPSLLRCCLAGIDPHITPVIANSTHIETEAVIAPEID